MSLQVLSQLKTAVRSGLFKRKSGNDHLMEDIRRGYQQGPHDTWVRILTYHSRMHIEQYYDGSLKM